MGLQGKIRVALVGDAGCGKTALAVKFSQSLFIDYYYPTESVQDFSGQIDTRKGARSLTVLDTSSTNEEIRALSYSCSNVVVVCFDLTRRETLESVENKWLPELHRNCPGIPFIIAGCKRDEMYSCVCQDGTCCCKLGEEELIALLTRTGASAYMDCSALEDENVDAVFGVATECVKPKPKKSAKRLVSTLMKKLTRV